MDDAALVKQFKNGNSQAFEELVMRHSRPLTLMLIKMIRNQEEAKDLSQQVFLKAYQALPKFNATSSFKTWLYSIAMNSVKDHFRKYKRVAEEMDLHKLEDPKEPVHDLLDRKRSTELLRSEIRNLPEKQRSVLTLRIYEEMDYREIADIVGCSEGAARANFFQAMKTLKEKMGTVK